MEAYKSSGETSVKTWCKLNQVSSPSMYQWMNRLQMEHNGVSSIYPHTFYPQT
ncbi:hypothetical protein [Lysinibacillus telephonicus]|uniref:hypothetical protein n=1 Tax=Lysinibacillus telephonicus TaxID=1714840 RepID=UPI003D155C8E